MGELEIAVVDGVEYQVIRVLECDFAALLEAKSKAEARVKELETFLARVHEPMHQPVSDGDGGAD